MARITVNGLDVFKKGLRSRVDKAATRAMKQLTKEEVRIKKDMRRGNQPFINEKFPRLKKTTIKNREYLAKYNTTHEAFTPKKSNITLSGQLVNAFAIITEVFRASPIGASVNFVFKDTKREKYKGANGRNIKGPNLSNAQVAEYLEEKKHLNYKVTSVFIKRFQDILKRNFYMFFK